MWDLPGSGIELVSPALAGGFLPTTTRKVLFKSYLSSNVINVNFNCMVGGSSHHAWNQQRRSNLFCKLNPLLTLEYKRIKCEEIRNGWKLESFFRERGQYAANTLSSPRGERRCFSLTPWSMTRASGRPPDLCPRRRKWPRGPGSDSTLRNLDPVAGFHVEWKTVA